MDPDRPLPAGNRALYLSDGRTATVSAEAREWFDQWATRLTGDVADLMSVLNALVEAVEYHGSPDHYGPLVTNARALMDRVSGLGDGVG